MDFFKRFLKLFCKKEPAAADKVFTKVIYNWKKKTQKQMYKALETEVEYLKRSNPGYELKGFSKPLFCRNDSVVYRITFKSK